MSSHVGLTARALGADRVVYAGNADDPAATVADITDPDVLAQHGISRGSRLRQLFEYQEQTSSFATFFTKGGLRLHNQVVYSQAEQAAAAGQ